MEHFQKKLNTGDKSTLDLLKTKGASFAEITDKTLLYEAERLRQCVQFWIDKYYFTHTPKYYERTYGLRESLKAETKVQYEGVKSYIGLYFDDSESWGKSVVTGEWNGYKPWLINDGWKEMGRSKAHFLGYKGYDFIEKGIRDWESTLTNKNIEVRRKSSLI